MKNCSSDFKAADRLWPRLRAVVEPFLRCTCPSLPAKAVFSYGFDGEVKRFNATVKEIKAPGKPRWWLWLGQCNCCDQHWLVVQEERIFDLYLVDKLSPEKAEEIVATNQWPDELMSYEGILKLCKTRGRSNAVMSPTSGVTIDTVEDLKAARPAITNAEIGALLGLSTPDVDRIVADEIVRKNSSKTHV